MVDGHSDGRVLLVEDDEDLAEVLQLTLEDAGYHAEIARNGREALSSVARAMPALVLLDIMMPVMDGVEFARQFDARHGRRAPIVVMTAAEHAGRLAAKVAADDVLAKPFGNATLLRVVARFVRMRSAVDPE